MSHRRRKLRLTSQGDGFPRDDDPALPSPVVLPPISLDDFNLEAAERRLCVEALNLAGEISGAARILGITRHTLRRRILKLDIRWPPPREHDPSE